MGFILQPYRFGGGNDGFTKVLLHFDGTDASTTITDSNAGGSAHTWTAIGNAQLDTGITKFGTATLLCDGTGDSVTAPDSADFTLGSGNFTIDTWFNRAGGDTTNRFMYGQANSAGTGGLTTWAKLDGANKIVCDISSNGTASAVSITSTTTFTAAGWHHLAFVRTGNTLKMFINGTQEGGDGSFASSVFDSSNSLGVGSLGELTTTTWFGSLDEFRLSVGIARWTANFTPPTAAYF